MAIADDFLQARRFAAVTAAVSTAADNLSSHIESGVRKVFHVATRSTVGRNASLALMALAAISATTVVAAPRVEATLQGCANALVQKSGVGEIVNMTAAAAVMEAKEKAPASTSKISGAPVAELAPAPNG